MIEEVGRVVAVSEREAWVQTVQMSACNACAAQKACGQKLLNSMTSGRSQQFKVADNLGLQVGDEVVVGIPESALLKASFLLYLIPLLTMILAAVGARELGYTHDGWTALSGFIGLTAGFGVARRLSVRRKGGDDFHPRLLRRAGIRMGGVTPKPAEDSRCYQQIN